MSKAAARHDTPADAGTATSPAPKRAKIAAFLVTGDVELWPQVGAHLPTKLNFRQIDSIDELLSDVPADTPAVVLWDARGCAEKSAELSRIQAHSARFAMLVLDDDGTAWEGAMRHGQIVSLLAVPVEQSRLIGALGGAYEEVNARVALLGVTAQPGRAGGGRRIPRTVVAAAALGVVAVVAGIFLARHGAGDGNSATSQLAADRSRSTPEAGPQSSPAELAAQSSAPAPASSTEETVDALIAQAQRAMRDRHFIEPPEGSALALYRSALALDPSSGEAQQSLQRLAEVLLARVQSALDERQFDAALQALENARSINPSDQRLPAFDERIAKMRAELGPAEILAAINAQNYDRAAQLIDQAARNKSVAEPKLNQLREELRSHRADSNDSRLVALIDARMQQDQLAEPPNDSAVYYMSQARKAGATSATLLAQVRELSRRLVLAARAAIAQQHLDEADRFAGDMRSIGAPLSQVAGVQREIGLARAQHPPLAPTEQPHFADLVQARLAQGSVIEPQSDSALHYLNQLKSSDPQNAAIASLSKAVQGEILKQAREALEASLPGQTEALLQIAASLGPSPEADALRDRLHGSAAAAGPKAVAEASLTRTRELQIDYPSSALSRQTEGEVEVGYIVTVKGAVSALEVLSATPPGVFEKAATSAVSKLRYKPVIDAGRPVAVSTKMLVKFRLAN
jgi:TonB family protein